ncbi:MAG: glycosyl transferase family 1, partial [Candidatus Nanoarchaeia archaeon]
MGLNEKKDMILFMGTFPPRECGIATFTRDLTNAIGRNISPQMDYGIVAMNVNGTNMYNYPKRVLFQVNDRDVDDYLRVAREINEMPEVKLICIQHEFGLFGENYGENIIPFLQELKKPVIITLHSILPDPDRGFKKRVRQLADNSDAFIVMANKAVEILRKTYGLTNEIYNIPHGIHFVPFEESC